MYLGAQSPGTTNFTEVMRSVLGFIPSRSLSSDDHKMKGLDTIPK